MTENKSPKDSKILNYIQEIEKKIGPRIPCSVQEKDCADLVCENMRKFCNEATVEPFQTHLKSYKASFKVPMYLYLLGLVFYYILPVISTILLGLTLFILFGQAALAYGVLDPFFKKTNSQNVLGKIKPKQSPKKILIIGSHIDSNWEFPLIPKIGGGFGIIIAINYAFSALFFIWLLIDSLIAVVLNNPSWLDSIELTMFIIFLVGAVFAFIQIFFIISDVPVFGANDNLAGVAISMALGEYFAKPENKLESTEIWIASFGCEEMGLKGSQKFAQKHLHELKNLDVKVINIDMPANDGPLLVGTSEIGGLVQEDPKIREELVKSAKDSNIVLFEKPCFAFTDTMSFCRKGIPASTLYSLPSKKETFYYHTRQDTIEHLNLKNLDDLYRLLVYYIRHQ
jgi:hypothetical protein